MKLALCLCGIVGGATGKGGHGTLETTKQVLKIGYNRYKKNLIDVNNADIFIHCWTKELEQEIISLYQPKKYTIEKQKFFEIPDHVTGGGPNQPNRKQNHYSRWYSTKKVVELKKQYEEENNFEYDFVMVSRFDHAWEHQTNFDQFEQEYFYAPNWPRWYHPDGREVKDKHWFPLLQKYGEEIKNKFNRKLVGYPYNHEGLLDQWFFANSKNMDNFANLFDFLDEYTLPGKCSTDKSHAISSHRLSLYHLEKLGLKDKIKLAFDLHEDHPSIRRKYFLTQA